ncbi:endonuclease MutS2 [Bacteroidales bacterium]|nr:endonuclease MutS2 [Bacteroidales bacterium]
MIYPENFQQKIGFDKIKNLIAHKCLCRLGEEKAESMEFSSDYVLINEQLHQTKEFISILNDADDFPSNYFLDVRESLKKIRIEGTYLLAREIFDIRRSLQTIQEIVRFFEVKKEESQLYPHLQDLAADVNSFPLVIKKTDTILDTYGSIKDNASPELYRIRKDLIATTGNVSKTLQSILRKAQADGYVEKDVAPTMRDGRLVIPLAPAFKRKLRGIVHDESATGKTIFIEPAEVVDANNRIRELESEERREIIRILTDFTNYIRPETPQIIDSYLFLAEIDFIRAKALFGKEIEAILPNFEDKQQMQWTHAVHPLLFLSLRRQNKKVVPLDIELHSEGRILIISGPNAGGKSVCLKTVGLLQYMLQSGMLIPMHESSKTGIFNDLFIDIGDEQSIENDLSTYSSHLTNMKYCVKNCNDKSLLLIDEFGSGTEPLIGGAIAEALLDRFNRQKSFGVITTHYQNLKHFAEQSEGIINAAMLYDRHLMEPLFKLSIGNPGSSFAIEIARKIGLPDDLIAQASQKVGQDYIDMDKYLQDIVRDKRYWEKKRHNIRQEEKKVEDLSNRYKTDLQKINAEKKELIAQAKMEAQKLLSDSNARIENTIRAIKESQADKEKTRTARLQLEAFKADIQTNFDAISASKEQKSKFDLNKKKDAKETKTLQDSHKADVNKTRLFDASKIEVGDAVRIKGQSTVGEVIQIKQNSLVLAMGSIKTTVKINLVEKVSKNQIKKETAAYTFVSAQTSESIHEKKLNFKTEIDVRGMRAEEALQAVSYYIDDAIQCAIGRVRILHGTGTGVLRQLIREYLSHSHGISSYNDEHIQFGGAGITIVEFE